MQWAGRVTTSRIGLLIDVFNGRAARLPSILAPNVENQPISGRMTTVTSRKMQSFEVERFPSAPISTDTSRYAGVATSSWTELAVRGGRRKLNASMGTRLTT
jgi:hypothetical protein